MEYPFLTADIPPISATIKADYDDFVVHEIPLYEPCGNGDHTYLTIEKRGLTTHQAIRDIAKALGVRPRDIGSAGIKDARGVTRQMVSVEHVPPEQVSRLSIPRLTIVSVSRHRNKLKTGHLRGNRFSIKLRDLNLDRFEDVNRIMTRLSDVGVPNYFGTQRFGNRGDTWKIGAALLKNDFETAVAVTAGTPHPVLDTGRVLEARTLFAKGRYDEALHTWPSGFSECRTITRAMLRFHEDHRRAMLSLDKRTLGFYVSAFQSHLFNQVLARRIDALDCVRAGDVAWKHENGAAFVVEDADVEMPRAKQFEISATGPLFGRKMKSPKFEVADLENEVLRDAGFEDIELPRSGPLRCTGGRRPIRFKPENVGTQPGEDDKGPFLELSFALPAGCYATSVLREVCKTDLETGQAGS